MYLLFSLFSVLFLPEPLGIYRCFTRTDGQAVAVAFSGKLLFRRKEEFYRKCTSKRRKQARQSNFASGKPTGEGRNEAGKAAKGTDIKGGSLCRIERRERKRYKREPGTELRRFINGNRAYDRLDTLYILFY